MITTQISTPRRRSALAAAAFPFLGTLFVAASASAVNQAPVAHSRSVIVTPGTTIGITLACADADGPGDARYTIIDHPSHGALVATSQPGQYRYTSPTRYQGPAYFRWTCGDGLAESARATVSLTTKPAARFAEPRLAGDREPSEPNERPVAHDQSFAVNQGKTVYVALDCVDGDGPDLLSYTITDPPDHGQLLSRGAAGKYDYVADAEYDGSDSFGWTCNDGLAESNEATATMAVNRIPVANDQSVGTSRTEPVTIQLSYYDDGLPGPHAFTITEPPVKGTLADLGLGRYLYTPNGDRSGLDTIKWTVTDGMAVSNIGKAQVEINDAPLAHDQELVVNQDEQKSITLELSEDFYPAAAEIRIEVPPAHGQLEKLDYRTGYRYIPVIGYAGPDSFQWSANDGFMDSNVATVSITVNARPVAADQSLSTPVDQGIDVDLDYTDDGIPGPYTIEITTPPGNGQWTELGFARYRYTPDAGYTGTDTVFWRLNDGLSSSKLARVKFDVTDAAGISLSPSYLQFYNTLGDTGVSATMTLTNAGDSPMTWETQWTHEPGEVRSLTPDGGTLAAGGSVDIALAATISADREWTWFERIEFTSPEADNSPVSMDLLFRVAAAGDLRLGISTPPIDVEERDATEDWLTDLGVELFRTAVSWDVLEPAPGEFKWKQELEGKLQWAHDRDLSAMLLLSTKCPDWVAGERNEDGCAPDDMSAWRTYVAALMAELDVLAAEYPNGLPIRMFVVGNEWHNTRGYPGTAEQFTEQLNIAYAEAKKVFPQIPVAPGGIGSYAIDDFVHDWSSERRERVEYVLANGEYDVVNQHLYFDYLAWPAKIDALRNLALPPGKRDIPIVVGEFGGPHAVDESRDDIYHAERVALYIEALRQTDVTEAYYYTLVEVPEKQPDGEPNWFAESGLIDKNTLLPKPGYYVFQRYSFETGRIPTCERH